MSNNLKLKKIHELDSNNIIGFYAEGHVDKKEFLSLIRFSIREGLYWEVYENDSYKLNKAFPVTLPHIHYKYFLLEPETKEFYILSDSESEGYLPITIYFFSDYE